MNFDADRWAVAMDHLLSNDNLNKTFDKAYDETINNEYTEEAILETLN